MDHLPVWQRGFYDHIIRNDLEYERITQYIETNPMNWQEDQLLISHGERE
jgi:putative transposase